MDLYGPVFRALLHPLWERGVRRRPTLALWRELDESQWRSIDELLVQQAAALRRLVAHAYEHVPFYRARFERAGVAERELEGPLDLGRLPILTAADLRGTEAERSSTVPPRPTIRKRTSGSTGRPLEFGYDPLSQYWREATRLRGYGWAGFRPGNRSLHFWGSSSTTLSRARRFKIALDHRFRREHYLDCGRRDERTLARVVDAIRRERPSTIVCYAQAGADLARYVVERALRTWDDIPVICGAEALAPSHRALLERAFGPGIFETYGCREVMLIAAECPAHAGLHLSIENLMVELVVRDERGERPARPGEVGEVVLTDLHNFGMPFIRYANGDLAVAAPPGPCACGRSLPRLERVEGRVTETLRNGAGEPVGGLLFAVILSALPSAVRQFQAVQHQDGSVTLKVVPTEAFEERMGERILEVARRYLTGVSVRIEVASEIPCSPAGKRALVRVER